MTPDQHIAADPILTSDTSFLVVKGIKWTAEKCHEAADAYEKHCRETAEVPTGLGYQKWREGHDDIPLFTTLMRFFDARQWTRNRCTTAILEFEAYCQQAGEPPTTDHYDIWRKTNKAPTRDTLMKYLGQWDAARTLAHQTAEITEEPKNPGIPCQEE